MFSIFQEWLGIVENQTGRKLKCLRLDNSGEYKSEEFVRFCRQRDIQREYMVPHHLEENGIAKRMNQAIQERNVSMLHHFELLDGL